MPKRSHSGSREIIRKKIKKLELELQQNTKRYNRLIIYSDSENEGSDINETEISNRSITCSLPLSSLPSGVATVAAAAASDVVVSTAAAPSTAPAPMNVTDNSSTTKEIAAPELDNEILEALGDAPKLEIKLGKPTHKDLASRWQEILEKGLAKDDKDKIINSYLIPENCDLLIAPTLNAEVKAALADNLVKRDNVILSKQKQISVAIAALNQAAELIIAKETHTKILKPISDACRLLCDSHNSDTKTRRGFVISAINPDMKDVLSESKRDKLLFGDNISEKLKSAKSIKRSGADLKQIKAYRPNKFNINNFVRPDRQNGNNRLNWKTMPRKITPKAEYRKPRQPQAPQRTGPQYGSQRRDTAAERAAVARNTRRR